MRRPRLQFRLSTLLLITLAVACWFGGREYEHRHAQIEDSFVGLGIELKVAGDALQIVKVISGSPAECDGILAGDKIISVDGQSTADLSTDQAANLLQGREGSTTDVTVVTAGQLARQLRIRRKRVKVDP